MSTFLKHLMDFGMLNLYITFISKTLTFNTIMYTLGKDLKKLQKIIPNIMSYTNIGHIVCF